MTENAELTAEEISTHTLTWSVTKKGANPSQPFTISTHTLTWSVTVKKLTLLTKLSISTHTLTWSVTWVNCQCWHSVANFNSHAHVERDFTRYIVNNTKNISTHTLTWSVTLHRKGWHDTYMSRR